MWIRPVWDRYETWFARAMGIKPLAPDSLWQTRCATYHGTPLQDGDRVILPGTRVLELHLRNLRLADLNAPGGAAAWAIRDGLRRDLPLLYRRLLESQAQVGGVVSMTLLARGAKGLGFHVTPMPRGLWTWWLLVYMSWLERLYRIAPVSRKGKRRKPEVTLIWMTADELSLQAGAGDQAL